MPSSPLGVYKPLVTLTLSWLKPIHHIFLLYGCDQIEDVRTQACIQKTAIVGVLCAVC